ncbi:hypothetical protein ADL22_33345 [Streptomyces sp. NRRL F-4489]|uniref:hypothetical protein n=1 Tax=Streptomyces sp. NRRL F-4489 TaxID=1609095 RepID=UPI000746A2F2|nr:hypothetical protein [Streptomyces sp. NRRL F-4489]KUL33430.1 hypothetical protein ADL22_33345 [Streptomyces sp. NRRL F-4489]
MGGFAESVRERVRAARAAVEAAQAADDAYALAVAQDELDDALRIARSVGVDPDRGTGDAARGGAAE